MKDLILVSAYCNTKEKEDILRNLINQIYQENNFDILLISHTVIPDDISNKCTLSVYDSKNELLYDWNLRPRSWFNSEGEREIQSIFTGFFNTHLAVWRMVILGNLIAKNLGYNKIHHIEYDCDIKDFTEIYNNSKLLDEYDCVIYTTTSHTTDPICFGAYQAYRLDTLHEDLFILNEENIKNTIKNSDTKSPEGMLLTLLSKNKKTIFKNKSLLDLNNNFSLIVSYGKLLNKHIAWCLPYYDQLTNMLTFIIWNSENSEDDINVQIIYNDNTIINFEKIQPQHWIIKDIDLYDNANKLVVLLNNQIRNIFDFTKNREEFKTVSFRKKN